MSKDESPGVMSDDEAPVLEAIWHWPNVEAVGTEGDYVPQPERTGSGIIVDYYPRLLMT
jgi:hypothetical protein